MFISQYKVHGTFPENLSSTLVPILNLTEREGSVLAARKSVVRFNEVSYY
jgi:hypothetical protein